MSTTRPRKTPTELLSAFKQLDKPKSESINKTSSSIFKGICTADADVVRVYNLHGAVGELIRMTYVATQLRKSPGRAIFIVDDAYYDDAVDNLLKHFEDLPHKMGPEDEWMKFERFTVVLGGPENRHARKAGGEMAERYQKSLEEDVAQVLECLKDFAPKDRQYPEFIWHNSTSAELPSVMPTEVMCLCKAVTFASAVVFYPSEFIPGNTYAWSRKSHNLLTAKLSECNVPLIYIDGSAIDISIKQLSHLPEYTTVWPELFHDFTWADAIHVTKVRVALWLMRWAEGKAGRHGEESAKRAKDIFGFEEGEANKGGEAEEEYDLPPFFYAEAYSKEDCNAEEAAKRADAIAHDLACPVDFALGAAAGMVFDTGKVPKGGLILPVKVDFKEEKLSIDSTAHTYLYTATSSADVEKDLLSAWAKLLERLKIVPDECKMPYDLAESWVRSCEYLRPLAREVGDREIEKQLREGEMLRLCQKVLH